MMPENRNRTRSLFFFFFFEEYSRVSQETCQIFKFGGWWYLCQGVKRGYPDPFLVLYLQYPGPPVMKPVDRLRVLLAADHPSWPKLKPSLAGVNILQESSLFDRLEFHSTDEGDQALEPDPHPFITRRYLDPSRAYPWTRIGIGWVMWADLDRPPHKRQDHSVAGWGTRWEGLTYHQKAT